MNYLAFQDNKKCSIMKVWVPAWKIYVTQPLLICNVGPSVISLDTLNESSENFKLFLFPKTKSTLMMFKNNGTAETYKLWKIFKNFFWNRYTDIPPAIFGIPVPHSYSTINEIYNQLYNEVEHLN